MKKILTIIIILILLCFNVTGSIVKESKNRSTVIFDDNILYVGGSGPVNYTTIKDAINDASDGDTIFVW